MGLVHAAIELTNNEDVVLARNGYKDQDEIKRMWVNMLVDTGAIMPAINEGIQEALKFPVLERKTAELADGRRVECDVVGPIDFKFKDRSSTCKALVLPGDSTPLLGAIPMEEMDLVVHPRRQELVANPEHPEYALMMLKYSTAHY